MGAPRPGPARPAPTGEEWFGGLPAPPSRRGGAIAPDPYAVGGRGAGGPGERAGGRGGRLPRQAVRRRRVHRAASRLARDRVDGARQRTATLGLRGESTVEASWRRGTPGHPRVSVPPAPTAAVERTDAAGRRGQPLRGAGSSRR